MRATNWLGDAVMSLPAVRAIRQVFPHARLVTCLNKLLPARRPGLAGKRGARQPRGHTREELGCSAASGTLVEFGRWK